MIKITIDDRQVQRLLKDLASKIKDMRPVMKNIAGIMHDAVEENFKMQGRPKWQPLKPSTIIQRAKKGYWPGQILQQRGSLASSISQKYNHNTAQVGTNKKYAAIHQFGFKGNVSIKAHTRKVKSRDIKQGRKIIAKGIATVREHSRTMNIPERPFLKLTVDDLEKINKTIVNYLQNATNI